MGECLNLIAEIARARPKLRYRIIARALDISERTLRDKIKGNSDFTWRETTLIHDKYFPELDKEYLFERAKDKAS